MCNSNRATRTRTEGANLHVIARPPVSRLPICCALQPDSQSWMNTMTCRLAPPMRESGAPFELRIFLDSKPLGYSCSSLHLQVSTRQIFSSIAQLSHVCNPVSSQIWVTKWKYWLSVKLGSKSKVNLPRFCQNWVSFRNKFSGLPWN